VFVRVRFTWPKGLWLNFSVRSPSPHQLTEEQDLYSSALRALMRRAHSIHEMRALLERRAASKDLIAPVLARLKEHKYLDDARYALDFVRLRAQSRRQGRFRIARELRARGVPDRHIEAALDSIFAETDESFLIRARLKRRLARFRGPLDQRKLASLYRSLLAAGFSADAIRAELRGVSRGDLPDLPDASDLPAES
jgi:regulatory protein